MVRPVQIVCLFVGILVFLLMPVAAQPGGAADDSFLCVTATRDWKKASGSMTSASAREFLRNRVKSVCPRLAARVRTRIVEFETSTGLAQNPPQGGKVAPRPTIRRPSPNLNRTPAQRPVSRPSIAVPRRTPVPVPVIVKRPHFRQSPFKARDLLYQYPIWDDVLERYPQLRRLENRGGSDLCAACLIGPAGYLQECEIAGRAAADRSIREGAKLMMSMIRIARRDGRPAGGIPVGIPVAFGHILPPPPGGYCSNPESDFRP